MFWSAAVWLTLSLEEPRFHSPSMCNQMVVPGGSCIYQRFTVAIS